MVIVRIWISDKIVWIFDWALSQPSVCFWVGPTIMLHSRNSLLGNVSMTHGPWLEKNRASKSLLAGKFVRITLLAWKQRESFLELHEKGGLLEGGAALFSHQVKKYSWYFSLVILSLMSSVLCHILTYACCILVGLLLRRKLKSMA